MRKTFALICIILAITACSTQKNTRMSRGYHNLNARYNALFNGRESIKAGELSIEQSTRNDYAQLLPLFEYSKNENVTGASSNMERAIQKGTILIAKHSITKKPKTKPTDADPWYRKFYNQKEFNKWVDEAWMLIGKGKFYQHDFNQAIQTFDVVIRDFSHTPTLYQALLWKAAAYSEKGDFANARLTLENYDSWGVAPPSLYGQYMAVYADLLLKQQRYEAAIPYLRGAADNAKGKHKKLRYRFVLGQVLALTGQNQEAETAFRRVIKMKPPYEMAINAQIARVSLGTEHTDISIKNLNQLARNKKNVEYLDRIYYSLAIIHLQNNDENEAINNLQLSTQYSQNNDKQKGLSFLKTGDIYFNRPEYKPAYMAYDSALLYLPETDELRSGLINQHASLKTLVTNMDVVQREDSLQALAKLPEGARLAMIDKVIEAEQKRIKEEEEQRLQNSFIDNDPYYSSSTSQMQTAQQGAKWYFYNPSTLTLGKAEFERKWGKRKLEDNWRRANKAAAIREELPDMEDPFGETPSKVSPTNPDEVEGLPDMTKKVFTRDALLKDIPLTPAAIDASNRRIEESLLLVGKTYNDQLNDYPRASQTFEELLRRFPKGRLREETFIELFAAYQNAGDARGMNSIKERMAVEFPNSKFYAFLSDPQFFEKMDVAIKQQDKDYQTTYENYLNGNHQQVINQANKVEQANDDNTLLPKYRLLKSLAFAREGDAENFKTNLQIITAKHANTQEAELAQSLLDELDKGRMPVKGPVQPSQILSRTDESTTPAQTIIEASDGYAMHPDGQHSLLIWVNRYANTKQLLFNVADYNFSHFLVKDYDLQVHTLPDQTKLLEVKGFDNQIEAMDYLYAVRQNPRVFHQIEDENPRLLVISSPNLKYMLSSGDVTGYLPLYLPNYLKVTLSDDDQRNFAIVDGYLRPTSEKVKPEEKTETKPSGFSNNDAPYQFVLIYETANVNAQRLQTGFINLNRSNQLSHLKVSGSDFPNKRKALIVNQFKNKQEALRYLELIKKNNFTIREIQARKHHLLLITADNFDMLQQQGDIDAYLEFFNALP